MSIIGQIVDRCHVGESNVEVIKYVVSRLRDGRKTFFKMTREQRRALMSEAVKRHEGNRDLYAHVMTGGVR